MSAMDEGSNLLALVALWPCLTALVPSLNEPYFFRKPNHERMGPDFLIILAVGQFESARQSVRNFHDAGYRGWTMRHAFFADMGGFLVECSGKAPIALNAEQLLLFIRKGYVDDRQCFDKAAIDDKNKHDGLARIITVLQALIFAITAIGRVASGLSITTLELTTLAFIFAMLATSCFWRHKPQDVTTGIVLKTGITSREVLNALEESDAQASHDQWLIRMMYKWFKNILRWMIIHLFRRRSSDKDSLTEQDVQLLPDRIPGDNFPTFSLLADVYCGGLMQIYSCSFLAGWNFYFPTPVERNIWRAASVTTLIFTNPCGFVLLYFEYYHFDDWKRRNDGGWVRKIIEFHCRILGLRMNTSSTCLPLEAKDTNLVKRSTTGLPPWGVVYCTGICAIYTLARIYILVEDVIGLRRLPKDVFETVTWSQYLPQI
ncbi:uncharacterized protein KY384_009215 [Bacidia gigantensis]|uniref:uncharacterized protein n=1 Tax=Bacidia gigantensis TaxID=2732470 RepID=UPI001D05AA36|nr:uncharacterized protein KY384_009215 [Bacidia gigantensis]KAG8525571.1 hypothetical protein KY384_009215 [Bacidia gigantensis]